MIGETTLTMTGNLVGAPELRYTQTGTPVANFTVASTPRSFDRAAGQWRDVDPLFLRCTAWGAMAEHATDSLGKGTRVIVAGRLRQRSFDSDAGERRTVVELTVDELGLSLRYATTQITKTTTRSVSTGAGEGEEPPDEPAF